jgi:hypothetical protein
MAQYMKAFSRSRSFPAEVEVEVGVGVGVEVEAGVVYNAAGVSAAARSVIATP